GSLTLNRRLPVFDGYDGAIAYSRFGLELLPRELKAKAALIKGGIDTDRFCPNGSGPKEKKILYVGRILPHKGVDYLIDAFRLLDRRECVLRIVGRIYDRDYYDSLRRQSSGLRVEFVHDADDERLIGEYRSAMVTVLPSVHRNSTGGYTRVPELMGFTLLESQACGTPVICTDAGAMSEFVNPGVTGWVVSQNSAPDLAQALEQSIERGKSDRDFDCRNQCREWVAPLAWPNVVSRCLDAYASAPRTAHRRASRTADCPGVR